MQLTTTRQGFAPTTITEAMEFSKMLSESQMVPKQYQGKPQDIMVCVQWGMEIGLAPLQALQNIAVINGKPSVYGDAAMALVQASPVCEDVQEFFEGEGGELTAVCVATRKGRKPVIAKFSVNDAKRAGLWAKQGPWSAYPKRMMQMRARGFALRDAFPDVLKGLITAEEAQDYPEDKPRPPKDITPRNPLDALAPPEPVAVLQQEVVVEEVELPEPVEVLQQQAEEAGLEVVDIPVVERQPGEDSETDVNGYALMVPHKSEPYSMHGTLEDWQEAYEALAEKTARAGKRPARERMTILRELREANEHTINSIDIGKRTAIIANYSKRIRALGAAQ